MAGTTSSRSVLQGIHGDCVAISQVARTGSKLAIATQQETNSFEFVLGLQDWAGGLCGDLQCVLFIEGLI